MEETDEKRALRTSLHFVCQNLQLLTGILNILREGDVITKGNEDEIMAKQTPYDRNKELIDCLLRKIEKKYTFSLFIEALKATGQKEIAEHIEQKQKSQPPSLETGLRVQPMLRTIYLTSFKRTNPFSLPFTFNIEKSWVSLALRDDETLQLTEDYHEILQKAFTNDVRMLVIEGKPATGKTTLMRRIAYDWAKESKELKQYHLVLYAEFRQIRDRQFLRIADLVIAYFESILMNNEKIKHLRSVVQDSQFFENHAVLVLLDGYDESSLDNNCTELSSFLQQDTIFEPLPFDIIVSTRPGFLTMHRGQEGRFVFADILGFTTDLQKQTFITKFFALYAQNSSKSIETVDILLKGNKELNELAEIPLFLTFICLLHNFIVNGTIVELYCKIVWYMLDRHQKQFRDHDIPSLFGFNQNVKGDKFTIIQNNFLFFPQLHNLGNMALRNGDKSMFDDADLEVFNIDPVVQKVGLLLIEEKRDSSLRRAIEFIFPHRTIQEFLAACSFFFSSNELAEIPNIFPKTFSSLKTMEMNETEKFLWRFATSYEMPLLVNRMEFFERFTMISIDFDIFTSSEGISIPNLNTCMEKCFNVETFYLYSKSNKLTIKESINLSKLSKLQHLYIGYLKKPRDHRNTQSQISETVQTENLSSLSHKSFISLPNNELSLYLGNILFESASEFNNFMEYILKFMKKTSSMTLDRVIVQADDTNLSYFSVSTNEEILQKFSPLAITPEIYTNQELNKALQFVSCATKLRICEEHKLISTVSFQNFPKIESLRLQHLPADSLIKLDNSSLNELFIANYEISFSAWKSIIDEISNSSIKRLIISIDAIAINEERMAHYLDCLQKCQKLESLVLQLHEEENLWNSLEEEFTKICIAFVQTMNCLKKMTMRINFCKPIAESNGNRIITAGKRRMECFEFVQTPMGPPSYFPPRKNLISIRLL